MTRSEWLKIAAVLQARWPNVPIRDDSLEIWFKDLEDLDAGQVSAAVEALYREGREFAPNGGQIRKRLIELRTDAGDWSQAYELAMEAATSHGGAEYGGLSWLREQDPVAADVAEAYGWRDFCLSDSTADGTRRAHFRDMFNLRAGKAAERERYRGLNAGGLRVIEQANEPRRMGDLVQLDWGEDAA